MLFYRTKLREKILLYILALIALIFIFSRFVLVPQAKAFVTTRNELKTARDQIKRNMDIIAVHDQEQKKLERAREKLHTWKALFSSEVGGGMVLTRLGMEAEKEGVAITFFQPKPVNVKEHYIEFPVNFGIRGPYQNVVNYMARIEDAGNIVNMAEIKMLAIEPWPGKEDEHGISGKVTAKLRMVIYADEPVTGKNDIQDLGHWVVGRENGFIKPEIPTKGSKMSSGDSVPEDESIPFQVNGDFPFPYSQVVK